MGSRRPQEGGNQTQNTQERLLEGSSCRRECGAAQLMDLGWKRSWSPAFKVSASRALCSQTPAQPRDAFLPRAAAPGPHAAG